jgi:hypothetical protein
MENFSNKQGRPHKFFPALEAMIFRDHSSSSARTRNNKIHAARALAALVSDKDATGYDYSYLFSGSFSRSVLLYELGRWGGADPLDRSGDEQIVELARLICERRMKTVDGVALLRRIRIGRDDAEDIP